MQGNFVSKFTKFFKIEYDMRNDNFGSSIKCIWFAILNIHITDICAIKSKFKSKPSKDNTNALILGNRKYTM